ncbi:hypothetical protein RA307_31935 [Xanthobacteraceae bacterium Astr-EGSB]|uniref:hypothetical protein n=1 Tax=Astrobacterium formosum TaxID=3069710 RepID=UPI0027AE07F3|nr:hypothetical protein [Xanthobacteraceae bacterium Astr-EGSB]
MSQIDHKSYQQGRNAFANGTSLRSIVSLIMASQDMPPELSGGQNSEEEAMSTALGFFDAAFDELRGIKR